MSDPDLHPPERPGYPQFTAARTLLNAIPWVGGAADALVATRLENVHRERLRLFREEIEIQGLELTEEMLENDDVLHAAVVAVGAAARTRHEEKRRLFARLFATYAQGDTSTEATDRYEEFVAVLDDLQPRELRALLIIRDCEASCAASGERDLQRAMRIWDTVSESLCRELELPEEQQRGFLTRLERTGLFTFFAGAILDYDGREGTTTEYFDAFAQALGFSREEEGAASD